MADPNVEPGDAPRLIRILAPVAQTLVPRLARVTLETLQRVDPSTIRRPVDAALSALACDACAESDPEMGIWAGVFTLRFLALNEELVRADDVLRASGVNFVRSSPEEDVVGALVELARHAGEDVGAVLRAAGTHVRRESWKTDRVERALATVGARAARQARGELEPEEDPRDRTPAFGMRAVTAGDWYAATVEVTRIDVNTRVPSEVSLEVGNGLFALVDARTHTPFFADSIAAVANVLVCDVTGGTQGVRVQIDRPGRALIVDLRPRSESNEEVAHAIALMAERARARS